jgi:hypothetical protein
MSNQSTNWPDAVTNVAVVLLIAFFLWLFFGAPGAR